MYPKFPAVDEYVALAVYAPIVNTLVVTVVLVIGKLGTVLTTLILTEPALNDNINGVEIPWMFVIINDVLLGILWI